MALVACVGWCTASCIGLYAATRARKKCLLMYTGCWLASHEARQLSHTACSLSFAYSWTGHKSGSGLSGLTPSILHYNWFWDNIC
jgi:hypothetical protein